MTHTELRAPGRALTYHEREALRRRLIATFQGNPGQHALWLLQHDLDDSDYRHDVVEAVVASLPAALQDDARAIIYGAAGLGGFSMRLVATVEITIEGQTFTVRYERP